MGCGKAGRFLRLGATECGLCVLVRLQCSHHQETCKEEALPEEDRAGPVDTSGDRQIIKEATFLGGLRRACGEDEV